MAPDPDEALSLLVESYHGEVWGEAIFGTLAELLADENQRTKLRTLTLLEATMAGFLAPLVPSGAADEAGQRASGEETAKALVHVPWSDFVGSIEPVTEEFLAKYRRLGEVHPAGLGGGGRSPGQPRGSPAPIRPGGNGRTAAPHGRHRTLPVRPVSIRRILSPATDRGDPEVALLGG